MAAYDSTCSQRMILRSFLISSLIVYVQTLASSTENDPHLQRRSVSLSSLQKSGVAGSHEALIAAESVPYQPEGFYEKEFQQFRDVVGGLLTTPATVQGARQLDFEVGIPPKTTL